MKGYLGETNVTDQNNTDPTEMALLYILSYGSIDGAHHKDWVLDQVVRILNGAPVTVKQASWDNGHSELRYSVGTCEKYKQWVANAKEGEEGPDTYGYDTGIAP